jgi:hypothetical protein
MKLPRIGRSLSLTERQYIALDRDALQVDVIDGYEVERKRVIFTDVELVTLHKARNKGWMWLTGCCSFLFLAIALMVGNMSGRSDLFLGLFFVLALPSLIMLTMTVTIPATHVTVFGKRTRACMRWWLRPGLARATFDRLCRLIAEEQEQQRRAQQPEPQRFSPGPADQ